MIDIIIFALVLWTPVIALVLWDVNKEERQQRGGSSEYNEPHADNHGGPRQPVVGFKTPRKYWYADHSEYEKSQRKFSKWTLIFSAFAAAGAIAAAVAAFYAFGEAKRQADEAHRQADATLQESRAYIISNSFKLITYGNKVWLVTPIIENAGNTPTKNLRLAETILFNPPSLGGMDFRRVANSANWNPPNFLHFVAGPKSEITGSSLVFNADQLTSMIYQTPFAGYGIAKYQDMAGELHLSEYCYIVRMPKIDYTNFPIGQPFRAQGFSCPEHNCADDECGADWKQRAQQ